MGAAVSPAAEESDHNLAKAAGVALAAVLDGDGAAELVEQVSQQQQSITGQTPTPDELARAIAKQAQALPTDLDGLRQRARQGSMTLTVAGLNSAQGVGQAAAQLLRALTPLPRIVVSLRTYANTAYAEIAQVLKLEPDDVAHHMQASMTTLVGAMTADEQKTVELCEQSSDIDRYLDRELPPERRPHLEDHLGDCQLCATSLSQRKALREALRQGLARLMPFARLAAVSRRAQRATVMPGTTLGDYQLRNRLGAGGMGTVYRAQHLSLGREVALKTLLPELAEDATQVKRFLREAKAAARLQHPNVVRTFDAGEDKGVLYHVMECVEGESLSERLRRDGPLALGDALDVVHAIGLALTAAQDAGIVHRDIKPANIMLPADGSPAKLADLGLARFHKRAGTELARTLTQTGVLMGTPAYMAPEQIRATRHVDHRADIYSLGITFYHMLTGELPFQGDSPVEILTQALDGEVVVPRSLELPADVEGVLLKMTRADADLRYQDPWDLVYDLEAVRGGKPVRYAQTLHGAVTAQLSALKKAQRSRWGRRSIWAVSAVVAVVALGGLMSAIKRRMNRRPAATQVAASGTSPHEQSHGQSPDSHGSQPHVDAGSADGEAGVQARDRRRREHRDHSLAGMAPPQGAENLFAGETQWRSAASVHVQYPFTNMREQPFLSDFNTQRRFPPGVSTARLAARYDALKATILGPRLSEHRAWDYLPERAERALGMQGVFGHSFNAFEWKAGVREVQLDLDVAMLSPRNLLVIIRSADSQTMVVAAIGLKLPRGGGALSVVPRALRKAVRWTSPHNAIVSFNTGDGVQVLGQQPSGLENQGRQVFSVTCVVSRRAQGRIHVLLRAMGSELEQDIAQDVAFPLYISVAVPWSAAVIQVAEMAAELDPAWLDEQTKGH